MIHFNLISIKSIGLADNVQCATMINMLNCVSNLQLRDKIMDIYLVGGAIRDQLLGIPNQEKDWVVVGSTPDEMLDMGFKTVGKDFPVFLHPDTGEEYALARTERKTAPGYGGFEFYTDSSVTLEADLKRRDLTINAIAEDRQGHLIDPYHGQDDLQQRILRHISPAFVEDPVRVLRVARFHAKLHHLGFQVAEETLQLMQAMVSNGEINALTPERVWKELEKALGEKHPGQFFLTLKKCNALDVLFPELNKLFSTPFTASVNCGEHLIKQLDMVGEKQTNPRVVFAVCFHQYLPDFNKTQHIAAIEQVCQQYRIPRDYQELAVLVAKYHEAVAKLDENQGESILNILEGIDSFRRPQRLLPFLEACQAIYIETTHFKPAILLQTAHQVANTVTAQAFIAQGMQGPAIAKAIHEKRVSDIKHALKKT